MDLLGFVNCQCFGTFCKFIASNLCKEADSSTCAGIVGFGNFGQFIATRFIKQGHKVRLSVIHFVKHVYTYYVAVD